MNVQKILIPVFLIPVLVVLSIQAQAQVVVNGKNLNDDKDLEYIQLMYLIDKGTMKPIFFVDYGVIGPEYNEILKPKDYKAQGITIDGQALNDRITVVGVLNKMHKAGWEYMGDVVYVPIPMMDDWHVFTLKRK